MDTEMRNEHYFVFDDGTAEFYESLNLLLKSGARMEDCYVYEGELDEENYDDDDDDYREVNAQDHINKLQVENVKLLKFAHILMEKLMPDDVVEAFMKKEAKWKAEIKKLKTELHEFAVSLPLGGGKEIAKLKTELAEMTQFHEWDKVATLKWNEAKGEIEKLKENYKAVLDTLYNTEDTEYDLLGDCGDICEDIERKSGDIEKLKAENEKLKKEIEEYEEETQEMCGRCLGNFSTEVMDEAFDPPRHNDRFCPTCVKLVRKEDEEEGEKKVEEMAKFLKRHNITDDTFKKLVKKSDCDYKDDEEEEEVVCEKWNEGNSGWEKY